MRAKKCAGVVALAVGVASMVASPVLADVKCLSSVLGLSQILSFSLWRTWMELVLCLCLPPC